MHRARSIFPGWIKARWNLPSSAAASEGIRGGRIPVGVYHYSYARTVEEAKKEAAYCLSCIRGWEFDLPVFFDMEERSAAACGRRVCTDMVKAFCGEMKKAGRRSGLYTNPNWLKNYLYPEELLGKYPLWLAQWDTSRPSYECTIWQYRVGKKGTIAGIPGEIDLDLFYGTLPGTPEVPEKPQENAHVWKVGEEVRVIDPIIYGTDRHFVVYPDEHYTIIEVRGDRAVIGINGQVTAAISTRYIRPADKTEAHRFQVGERVQVLRPLVYGTNERFVVYPKERYTIIEVRGDRAVIGINGQVTAAVSTENIRPYPAS